MAFVIDPRLSKDVTTITLSYTFFEVGGKTPAAPSSTLVPQAAVQPAQQAVPVVQTGYTVQSVPVVAARPESRS